MSDKETITYEGWLNEQKLVETLTTLVGKINGQLLPCGYKETAKKYKPGTQIKLPESRSKYDFGFSFGSKNYLVEFDGNYKGVGHYNNAENCYNDKLKNDLAEKHGYKIIRFPYWLQLDNETFELLFEFKPKYTIKNNFPHGFITNSSLNPASFCKLGLRRFKSEFEKLPESIKFEVLVSLKVKSDRLGIPLEYVWDDKLLTEIENKMGFREKYCKIKEFADEFNK